MYYTILLNTEEKIYEVLLDTPDYWFNKINDIKKKLRDYTFDIHMIDDEYEADKREKKKDEIVKILINRGYKKGLVSAGITGKWAKIKK